MTQSILNNLQSHRLDEIKPSGIRKMFARAQGLEGVISLGIGLPDLMPPEGLLEALVNASKIDKSHFYTLNSGTIELRNKIADRYSTEHDVDYDAESVVVGAGGTEMLFAGIYAYTNPGDEILVPDPGFVYYPTIPAMAGCVVKPFNLDDDFQIPVDNLAEMVTSKTKAIILNSPNNPCGSVLNEKSLKAVADLAIDHNFLIFSDEVYEYITFDGLKHVPIASLAPENTITLNSFSKTYCVTGWRLGFSIANKELIQPMAKMHAYVVANAPSLFQFAVSDFMGTEGDKAFRSYLRETMQNRRDTLFREFSKIPGLSIPKVTGSFYAFPKIEHEKYSSSHNSGMDFAEDVFTNAKVVLVPGSEFGQSRNDHVRISFGSANEQNITESAQRIRNFLEV